MSSRVVLEKYPIVLEKYPTAWGVIAEGGYYYSAKSFAEFIRLRVGSAYELNWVYVPLPGEEV